MEYYSAIKRKEGTKAATRVNTADSVLGQCQSQKATSLQFLLRDEQANPEMQSRLVVARARAGSHGDRFTKE